MTSSRRSGSAGVFAFTDAFRSTTAEAPVALPGEEAAQGQLEASGRARDLAALLVREPYENH
jgi:hypothetical protein